MNCAVLFSGSSSARSDRASSSRRRRRRRGGDASARTAMLRSTLLVPEVFVEHWALEAAREDAEEMREACLTASRE